MSIYVIGINYKTASITLREKAYFAPDQLSLYLQDLLTRGLTQEAIILSTCNRSDLYCETNDINPILQWFAAQTTLSSDELSACLYTYRDEQAIMHMMEVACGLDSMILGEPQILGQMKDAFSESCTAGAVSTQFHRLFQHIFAVAKEIRATTAIGACPVSVASAAIHFAKTKLTDFSNARLVLIGAGDTSMLLLRYLSEQTNHEIAIVNRTLDNAAYLTDSFNVKIYPLEQLNAALANADLVFSATGCPTPIVKQDMIAKIMEKRENQPLAMIDIAVPRDIELEVNAISNVDVYCIDDLKAVIEQNRRGREHAAIKARELIEKKSKELIAEMQSFDKVAHTIRLYRKQIEELCRSELIKAKQQLHQGKDPTVVLDIFAHTFVKKLLHTPSVQLRQAAATGDKELLQFVKQLFAISDQDIERL